MDRFDAMRTFARVVEAGSFTKAAQTLHMSKTTVTQLIQQLEARLRVKLLHRTTRSVTPTEAGHRLLARLAPALRDVADALADAVEAALRALGHLDVVRRGNTVVARTHLGRAERVVLAGHLESLQGGSTCMSAPVKRHHADAH